MKPLTLQFSGSSRAKSARLKEINKSLESKLEETNNDVEMMLNKFKNNLRK